MPQAPAHTRRGAEAQLAANPPRRKAGEATGQPIPHIGEEEDSYASYFWRNLVLLKL